MTLSLRLRSGTYKPMAAESTPPRPTKSIKCTVRLLDDNQQVIELEKSAIGQSLLDRVFDCLDLTERDYFSLQILDPHIELCGTIRWIEADKKIRKQFKSEGVYSFLFRVKFYVPDPCRLQEEYTRYHFFMQLKLDIAERRLWCTEEEAVLLASYAVQSELGDYNGSEHHEGYISEFRYFYNLSEKPSGTFDQRVEELHKQHRGQSPADAELNFLYHARNLATYGVILYEVASFPPSSFESRTNRPYKANDLVYLGISAAGVTLFRSGQRVLSHPWTNICKVSFKQRQFLISVVQEAHNESFSNEKHSFKKSLEENGIIADRTRDIMQHAAFSLSNQKLARSLWRTAVEYHTFFRLKTPPNVEKSSSLLAPFNFGFRYSGRTEFQGIEDMKRKMRTTERPFSRSSFNRFARRTISSTLPVQSSSGTQKLRNGSCHMSGAISVPNGSSSSSWISRSSFGFGIVNMTSSKPQISNDSTSHAHALPVPTANAPEHQNGTVNRNGNGNLLRIPEKLEDLPYYEEPPSTQSTATQQRFAGASPRQSTTNNAISRRSPMGGVSSHSSTSAPANSSASNFSVPLVTIKLRPDPNGRFGFNVKGGIDQQMAVVVSKVAPNTPADRAIPRLCEGDLLLQINSRDPNTLTHDDVVAAIKNSCQDGNGELVLVVRPQLHVPSLQNASPSTNRPSVQINGRLPVDSTKSNAVSEHFQQSIDQLRDSVKVNRVSDLIHRFERLERKHPAMSVSVAISPENMSRNRYRDITPYDDTRVKITAKSNGDYINANHVNMEIPGAGMVNRYICCQGPLPHTSSDFWLMAWEQQSTLVVMLTSLMEQGMVKCHQYWPNVNETLKYDNLHVTCHRENVIKPHSGVQGIVERQMSLVNLQTKEERHVTQLQYMAWPDHGVPDDPSLFIEFVQRVRSLRAGNFEPTIVHCSAGIGRTGVILVVETAMSLIEAGQPVDPIDIVRRLRTQRAMLVQNASQFVFACQAIVKVFDDKIITPVGDNSRK